MTAREIASNVMDVIRTMADEMAEIARDNFFQNHVDMIQDGVTESPIEDIFHAAIELMCRRCAVPYNPEPCEVGGSAHRSQGLAVGPQAKIGKYRVDFLLTWIGVRHGEVVKNCVVIELDGHDFHERTKSERSYEKRRDREMQRLGYPVLRFTGSDVVADPYRVAHEALRFACGYDIGEFDDE